MGRSASNITKLVLQHYNLDARAVPVQLRIAGGEALGEITVMPVGTFAGHAVVLIHGDNVDFVLDMTTGQFTNHLLEIHPEPVFIGCLDLSGRRGQDKR